MLRSLVTGWATRWGGCEIDANAGGYGRLLAWAEGLGAAGVRDRGVRWFTGRVWRAFSCVLDCRCASASGRVDVTGGGARAA